MHKSERFASSLSINILRLHTSVLQKELVHPQALFHPYSTPNDGNTLTCLAAHSNSINYILISEFHPQIAVSIISIEEIYLYQYHVLFNFILLNTHFGISFTYPSPFCFLERYSNFVTIYVIRSHISKNPYIHFCVSTTSTYFMNTDTLSL